MTNPEPQLEPDPRKTVYYVTAAGHYHRRCQVRFFWPELRVLWQMASLGMLAGCVVQPGGGWDD